MRLHELLSLKRPLVIVDFETTGIHVNFDRIVQIGVVKVKPSGEVTTWKTLVDPQIPIPKEASDVHHITNEVVKGQPTFREIAPKFLAGIDGCDFCGYNLARFDLKLLEVEVKRVGLEVPTSSKVVDVFRIYQKIRPRNLSECYRDLTGKDFPDAHDALADCKVTLECLETILTKHSEAYPLNTVDEIHKDIFETPPPGALDPDSRIIWRNDQAIMNFGDHSGKLLSMVPKSYWSFILKANFNPTVKEIARNAINGVYPRK